MMTQCLDAVGSLDDFSGTAQASGSAASSSIMLAGSGAGAKMLAESLFEQQLRRADVAWTKNFAELQLVAVALT